MKSIGTIVLTCFTLFLGVSASAFTTGNFYCRFGNDEYLMSIKKVVLAEEELPLLILTEKYGGKVTKGLCIVTIEEEYERIELGNYTFKYRPSSASWDNCVKTP